MNNLLINQADSSKFIDCRKDNYIYNALLKFANAQTPSLLKQLNESGLCYFDACSHIYNIYLLACEELMEQFYPYWDNELAKKFRNKTPLNDNIKKELDVIYNDFVFIDRAMNAMSVRGYGKAVIFDYYKLVAGNRKAVAL